jgi:hypothetical protein
MWCTKTVSVTCLVFLQYLVALQLSVAFRKDVFGCADCVPFTRIYYIIEVSEQTI